MTPPEAASSLKNTGIRIEPALRDKYVRAVRAKYPNFDIDLSKAIRMHMRETVAEYEAQNGSAA